MDLDQIPFAIAMVAIGVAFRPLNWLAAIGLLFLFVAGLEILAAIWPFILLGIVVLVAIGIGLVFAASMRENVAGSSSDWERFDNGLRELFKKRKR